MEVFNNLFMGKIRLWDKPHIVLLHIFSLFTPVNKIYKINKNIRECFNYFFNFKSKLNPLKDDVYELQKNVSDCEGQKLKEFLLKYYHDNNFLNLTLTFIDGHVIAYFGKEAFQRLKHGTRKKIMKALEVFNFSDKNGRIFYFNADHDVEGMQKNIELLLNDVNKLIGLDKIHILVFDRGGYSGELFDKLSNKYKIKFITLAVQNSGVERQIKRIRKKTKFKKLKGADQKKYAVNKLDIDGKIYRALLILHTESNEISPFITNMDEEELSNEELLQNYSMHWRQEQEHNSFVKLGGNMHSKALQEIEFEDTTKIKRKKELKNSIEKKKNEIVKLTIESRRLGGRKISLQSRIKPKSKQTDNKIARDDIKYIEMQIKKTNKQVKALSFEVKKAERKHKKRLDNPKKKKLKHGPVDYSISITNLANNINSRLVEIATKGKEKYQLSTVLGSFYSISAEISEDENNIYVEYFNIRQQKQINMVKNLCDYFNPKEIKLRRKTLHFSINVRKTLEK
jgi:hypothetical protein